MQRIRDRKTGTRFRSEIKKIVIQEVEEKEAPIVKSISRPEEDKEEKESRGISRAHLGEYEEDFLRELETGIPIGNHRDEAAGATCSSILRTSVRRGRR